MSGYGDVDVVDVVDVTGGTGGLEVEYDDLGTAAHVLQKAALDVMDTALDARGVLTDAGMLASSLLDPGGFARAEAAVLAAVVGPHGLLAAGARLEAKSLSLYAAVLKYAATDRLDNGLREARHWATGAAMLLALPTLPVLLTSPLGPIALDWASHHDAGAFLAEHPGVAEDAAGALPSFVSGLVALASGPVLSGPLLLSGHNLMPTIESESSLLALLYPAGSAQVVSRGTDTSAPPAPEGVGDLLSALEHRDGLSRGDAQGEIDVRRLTRIGPDGDQHTSWVVDLPGTKDWQLDPRERVHLNDLATNLETMSGDHCARIDGLTRALELAGVGRDEPVMLVGHSQGGLVALRAAEQYAVDGAFHVTHVVTAGSPIARMDVPDSVSVLALENRYDVVPQLDGRPSPDQHNRITVTIDAQTHDVGANHALSTSYVPGARDLDDDTGNQSLNDWRDSAQAFLAPADPAVTVRTTVWDIRNGE
jgi:pimeloyl-ACP methyl ester carboxylesterase